MEIMIINISMYFYFVVSAYQIYTYKKTIAEGAIHHLVSHLYIVLFFFISVNLFFLKGYVIPVLLSLLYMLQHLTKENMRLVKTSRWTESVSDEKDV